MSDQVARGSSIADEASSDGLDEIAKDAGAPAGGTDSKPKKEVLAPWKQMQRRKEEREERLARQLETESLTPQPVKVLLNEARLRSQYTDSVIKQIYARPAAQNDGSTAGARLPMSVNPFTKSIRQQSKPAQPAPARPTNPSKPQPQPHPYPQPPPKAPPKAPVQPQAQTQAQSNPPPHPSQPQPSQLPLPLPPPTQGKPSELRPSQENQNGAPPGSDPKAVGPPRLVGVVQQPKPQEPQQRDAKVVVNSAVDEKYQLKGHGGSGSTAAPAAPSKVLPPTLDEKYPVRDLPVPSEKAPAAAAAAAAVSTASSDIGKSVDAKYYSTDAKYPAKPAQPDDPKPPGAEPKLEVKLLSAEPPKSDSAGAKGSSGGSEKAKGEDGKAKAKTGGHVARLPSHEYGALQVYYRNWRGRRIHEPTAEMVPPLIRRDAALERHLKEPKLRIQVSQVMEMMDELWLFGRTNSTASVGLELLEFRPFFFVNCPPNPTKKTAADLHALLNRHGYWPKGWEKSQAAATTPGLFGRIQKRRKRRMDQPRWQGGDADSIEPDSDEDDDDMDPATVDDDEASTCSSPVMRVTLEQRKNAVIYTGGDQQDCFRIDFANMRALKHYREQLALRRILTRSIHADWTPRLYHEEHSLTQMFFHQTSLRLFDHVEVDPKVCNFLPTECWDRLEIQIEHDDEMRQVAVENGEQEDAGIQRRNLSPKHLTPRTWCHLEGRVRFDRVVPVAVEAVAPIPVCTFDIETACGDAIKFYRKHKIIPHYDDDIDAPEEKDKPKEKPPESKAETKAEIKSEIKAEIKAESTAERKVAPARASSAPQRPDASASVSASVSGNAAGSGASKAASDGQSMAVEGGAWESGFAVKHPSTEPWAHADGGVARWCAAHGIPMPPNQPLLAGLSLDNALLFTLTDLQCENSAHWMAVVAFPKDTNTVVLYENLYSRQFRKAVFPAASDVSSIRPGSLQTLSESEAQSLYDLGVATLDALGPPLAPLQETVEDGDADLAEREAEEDVKAVDAEERKSHASGQEQKGGKRKAGKRRAPPGGAPLPDGSEDESEEPMEEVRKRVEGRFPIPTKPNDAIILIATELTIVGDNESCLSVLHCLGKPAFKDTDLKDTVVFTFDENNEVGMLEHWARMTRAFDVEWLAGYNSISYDLPYVYQRARMHGSLDVMRNLARFQCLPHDRLQNQQRYKECLPHERRFGGRGINNEMPQVEVPGLIQFDALKVIKQLEKLNFYNLKEVAKELLKGKVQKKDLPHAMISPFYAAGPEFQRKLAIYCYYDVKVTVAVMVVRFLLGHAMEVARASWTSITQQMLQGAQIKTWNLICKTAHRDGWLLDETLRQQIQKLHGIEVDPLPRYLRKYVKNEQTANDRMSFKEQASLRKEKKYDGAFVLDPVIGLYDREYICTYDFASLYPSVICARNLCFSSYIEHRYDPATGQIWFPLFDDYEVDDKGVEKLTKVRPERRFVWWAEKERPSAVELDGRPLILVCVDEKTGHTDCFVQEVASLLPGILRDLTALRKSVKKQMEAAEDAGDKFQASVLDSRQSALKVLCNASYGFCGASAGFFGFIPIAIVTCFMGRLAIMHTKRIVETIYGGQVVYGDTDSVFVRYEKLEAELAQRGLNRDQILQEICVLSKKVCEHISSTLPPPMKLEFEKVFGRYLLLRKKQYAGLIVHPKPKLMLKGLAPVRRDCCPLAAECGKDTLKAALETPRDEEALLRPLKKAIAELINPNIPLTRLEKTVAKKAFYKNGGERLIQKWLFDKIRDRTGVEVETGSRVGYIVTLPQNGDKRVRGKDDKLYKDGEQTSHAQEMGIPPDRTYYLNAQIRVPLLRYLAHTKLAPVVNRLVQSALDQVWVQDSKNRLIHHYYRRKPLPPSQRTRTI